MKNFEWWPENHAETIRSLNNNVESYRDLFLPKEFIAETVLPAVGVTFVGLSFVYLVAYHFLAHRVVAATDESFHFKKRKFAYQVTNLCTNLGLGLFGLYYEFTLWSSPREISTQETVQGFNHLVYFSAWQLGYQLWAIPLGMFYVNEALPMLAHHFTVVVVSCMSGFLVNGFRFWTPFFYGLIELSSVPLAVMNTFKENPHLIGQYPSLYSTIRLVFAITFLYVRIVLFVPRKYMFLRDHMLLFTASDILPYKIFMSAVWISAFLLLLLQLFWATLIVKGLFVMRRSKKKPT